MAEQEKHDFLVLCGQRGGSSPKHKWTDEERAIVRRDYNGHNQSAHLIADRLTSMTGDNITFNAVKGQAAKMGILQDKSPRWTEREIKILEEMITQYSPITIAKRLHRSLNAVVVKSKRLGCSRRARDGWFTKKEVCEILGVDHHKVQKWIDGGELKASWHSSVKPTKNGGACWHIAQWVLRDFIIKHSLELMGRNVDLFTIVNILGGFDLPLKRNRQEGVT